MNVVKETGETAYQIEMAIFLMYHLWIWKTRAGLRRIRLAQY
jgi:hypothetical protein